MDLLDSLELWIKGTSPYVTVSNLGIQLRLDRSCPLHTNSITSNECLDLATPPAGGNGGAVAGALIGGILLGVILAVGVGSVILLLLWWKRRGGPDIKAKMMKKINPTSVGTTLATRYVPSTENLHQESTEAGYEPVGLYVKEGSRDHRAANTYDVQAGEQEAMKQKKQKKNSNKNSDKKVMEDESGYVVPDTLWDGKQRPVAPGSAASAEKTSKYTPSAPKTTTEYDVPEGIEHRDANKVKGQREPQSAQHGALSKKQPQQTSAGKDHQKQKLQAKPEPPKTTNQPKEQSQNNELKKSAAVLQGDKPTKKNKPLLHQKKENSSKLAAQYQSDTSPSSKFGKSGGAAPTSLKAAPAQQDHTAVKSKLQNLLTPAASPQPTTAKTNHAKLSKQLATSATEGSSNKKQHPHQQQQRQQQESQQVSKVMAMAQKLQGAVGQASAKGGAETTNSKSPGTKKKYALQLILVSFPWSVGDASAMCTCTHAWGSQNRYIIACIMHGDDCYVLVHVYVIGVDV